MNFFEIASARQSCRSFDPNRKIEPEKLQKIIDTALLSPSACNSQPYHVTVFCGESVTPVADAVMGMGMNKFAPDAGAMLVISEDSYNATAALGSKAKGNDYRSIDIGILASYITLEATAQGLGSCILGWLDDKKLRTLCGIDRPVRLVIALGYPTENYPQRQKKRKDQSTIFSKK